MLSSGPPFRKGESRAGKGSGMAGRAQPGEKGAQGDLPALHSSLSGWCRQPGRALLPGDRDRTRGKGLKLFSLDILKYIFMDLILYWLAEGYFPVCEVS